MKAMKLLLFLIFFGKNEKKEDGERRQTYNEIEYTISIGDEHHLNVLVLNVRISSKCVSYAALVTVSYHSKFS